MRIYIPATSTDLRAEHLSSRQAHAATPTLAQALPQEDEEGLELSASLCAADASLLLLAVPGAEALPSRRIVVAADVDSENVKELPVGEEVLPGTVRLEAPIPWDEVVALLVDEAAAEADVSAARQGDAEAFERAAEADLLWFDVSEREQLAAELGA